MFGLALKSSMHLAQGLVLCVAQGRLIFLFSRVALARSSKPTRRRAMGKKKMSTPASSPSPSPKKSRGLLIPDVADMGNLSSGGSLKPKPVFDERIHVGLYEYAKKGSLFSEFFGEGKLFVAQMATSCQPNPLYQNKKVVESYGASEAESEDPPPRTLDEVSSRFRAVHQFVWKKTEDKDDIGWAKGRIGWYIEDAYVKEFLMYFDDLMAWRKGFQSADFEEIEKDIKIVIHMLKSSTLELKFDPAEDELKCSFEVVKEDQALMSLFDLPPPVFPGRIVIMTFELLSPGKAHVVFSGNTKPFQTNFIKRNIKGKSVKLEATDAYGEYLRVLEHLSLEDANACAAKLTDIFEECLQRSPVVVRVKETKHDLEKLKSAVENFKDTEHIRIEI